jgi:ketosteroid isomerase-like protein
MSTAENDAAVRALYVAFAKGDGPGIFALLDPAVVWEVHAPPPHPYGGRFEGFAGTQTFLGAIAASVEVLSFAAEETVASGDLVVGVGHERLRVRATGKVLVQRWVHLFRMRGGKVVRFEEWFDSATALEAFRT